MPIKSFVERFRPCHINIFLSPHHLVSFTLSICDYPSSLSLFSPSGNVSIWWPQCPTFWADQTLLRWHGYLPEIRWQKCGSCTLQQWKGMSVSLSVDLSVCMSVCLSVNLSVNLSVCLSADFFSSQSWCILISQKYHFTSTVFSPASFNYNEDDMQRTANPNMPNWEWNSNYLQVQVAMEPSQIFLAASVWKVEYKIFHREEYFE